MLHIDDILLYVSGSEFYNADTPAENLLAQQIANVLAASAGEAEDDYKASYDATRGGLPKFDALDSDYQTAYVGQCILREASETLKRIKDGVGVCKTMDAFDAFEYILGR